MERTIEKRLNEIIRKGGKGLSYTDVHGTEHKEAPGEYSKEMTEAIGRDIVWYREQFMDVDKRVSDHIAIWQQQLCEYGEDIEQIGRDYSAGKTISALPKDVMEEMCEEIIEVIKLSPGLGTGLYSGFMKLCLYISARLSYISVWEYAYKELQLMEEVLEGCKDREANKLTFCRKKMLELLILTRDGDDHRFLMGELNRSWDMFMNDIRKFHDESQAEQ